jgi:CheY-like chemotaxis protein
MNSILLVDSETIVANALQTTLSRFGFEVELADSGRAAHAWLRRKHFDLILVEFDLSPHPNGQDCRRTLKICYGMLERYRSHTRASRRARHESHPGPYCARRRVIRDSFARYWRR